MWMLLHGFAGSPRSWNAVVSSASIDHEPVRPALLGHWPGWREAERTSFGAEVDRLAEIAVTMNRPRFLGGYSLGARVGLGLLATHRDLFDAALLIGLHPGLTDSTARRARLSIDAERAALLRSQGVHAFVESWEKLPLFDTQRTLPEEIIREQREIRSSHHAEGLARSLEVLGLGSMPSYADDAWDANAQIVLMAGALDAKFRNLALELAEGRPKVDAILVNEAGHNLLLEAAPTVAQKMQLLEAHAKGRTKP